MTDLWYTFGAIAANLDLFTAIGKANPKFDLIELKVTETEPRKTPLEYSSKSAGYLDATATTAVREKIRDFVAANFPAGAPPISLYTAGKLSQLWITHLAGLETCFTTANSALKKAAGGGDMRSPALLTIVGLCLLDRNFVTQNLLGPDNNKIAATAKEFGLDQGGAEWKTLQKFINDPTFGDAQDALMSANCWAPPRACEEVFVFYDHFKRAVN